MKRPSRGPRTPWDLLVQVAPHLGEYRDHVVVVGGLAKLLYRTADGFALDLPPSQRTKDVDFAIRDPLEILGGRALHDRLIGAGLRSHEQTGLAHQTVSCTYYPQELERPSQLDPHLEFVSPFRGPDRSEPVSRPQRDALHANPLRFVDLLLDEPWTVEHPEVGRLRVPHPLAYIVQKTRIRVKRQSAGKQARDQADAFYVLLGFNRVWSTWGSVLERWNANREWAQWLLDVRRTWSTIYAGANTPAAHEVADADEFRGRFSASDVIRIMRDFRAAVGLDGP